MKFNSLNDTQILVADRVDNMRNMIGSMLSQLGCKQIFQAKDGVQAWEVLKNSEVSIVISEHDLPKLNGLELLQKIRSDSDYQSLPVIIQSANVRPEIVRAAINSGVSEYLVKPFSLNMLQQRIKSALMHPVKRALENPYSAREELQTEEHPEKPRILLVDDEPDNLMLLSQILKETYQIKVVKSGKQAIKLCHLASPPDLILLDIIMPEIDGFEVFKKLKSSPATQHIGVIFLTSVDNTNDVVNGLKMGALDYIVKPVNPEILKARMKLHVDSLRTRQSLYDQIDTMAENLRLRNEFDKVIQNNLKKPLTEISRHINSTITKRYLPDKVLHSANCAQKSCQLLDEQIQQMNLVYRIEDGQYQPEQETINVASLLRVVADVFYLRIHEKGLELRIDSQITQCVLGEKRLLKSVLINLINNALEAAPRGSAITVYLDEIQDKTVINIHNKGTIPSHIRHRFFDKFVSYGKNKGSGLGTYSARLMTEIQKGRIDFSSSEKDGTTLRVYMPTGNKSD